MNGMFLMLTHLCRQAIENHFPLSLVLFFVFVNVYSVQKIF